MNELMNNKLLKYGLCALPLYCQITLATPSNDELYKMLLEVKNEQTKLKQQLFESKQRERNLQSELAATRSKLFDAKKSIAQPRGNQENEREEEEGFFASAGAIYIRPIIDGTGTDIVQHDTWGFSVADNALISQNMDFEPGFQVSAGYQASNNWDYTLKFKHFKARESANTFTSPSISPQLNGVGIGIGIGIGQELLNTPSSTVQSDYATNYNALDFEIGKQITLSENVSLRLSGGIRYSALSENWTDVKSYRSPLGLIPVVVVAGEGVADESMVGGNIVKDNYSGETDFWGIGPRITASPSWQPFGNNFRVFGNIGASLLMGQYELSRKYADSLTTQANKEGFFPIIEAGAGIGYDIDMGLVALDIQAGYQVEHWLDSDLTDNVLFRGFHGSYGTIGVKF